MKTITIKLASDKDAELLKSLLKSTKFEDDVETIEEKDSENFLTEEELHVVNERMEEYKRNPSSGKSLEETIALLKSKYGI